MTGLNAIEFDYAAGKQFDAFSLWPVETEEDDVHQAAMDLEFGENRRRFYTRLRACARLIPKGGKGLFKQDHHSVKSMRTQCPL